MKKRLMGVLVALLLLAVLPLSAAPQPGHNARTKKYVLEHNARMRRHRKLTPRQRHARMVRYQKEHQARQHRHRAHVKAQKHGE